jgi:hypothetical protein
MRARLLFLIAAIAALTTPALADDTCTLGTATFSLPPGWKQVSATDDRQTYASPSGAQQATISITNLDHPPTFHDFELLCAHRYDAEKNGIKDLILIPREPLPHNDSGQFTMTYSGEENPTSRVFSGFLWVKGKQLITLYVEGIGIASDRNEDAFKAIADSLR